MTTHDAGEFRGRQSTTEHLYEAHLFLTAAPEHLDELVGVARHRHFRQSSRRKVLDSGAHDVLLTRNGNDRVELESELRQLADELARLAPAHVYRIRLEKMILDEHRTS